ncbi:MAG: glycine--tRNA ligase subunit beta [Brevinema sp.]
MFDFLFELLVEEIPHSVLPKADAQLKALLPDLLTKHGLEYRAIHYFSTPRRLGFRVEGLPQAGASRVIEQKGPSLKVAYTADGKPSPALEGFFRSYNVTEADLSQQEIKGQVYLFVRKTQEGLPLPQILTELTNNLVSSLKFPEPMRWNKEDSVYEFIRPVRGIVALINDQILPLNYFGLDSSNQLWGHRQLHPQPKNLQVASLYEETLQQMGVVPSFEQRKASILSQAEAKASQLNATLDCDDELLSILACLTENPHVLLASFDERFLSIPKEVLISEMKVHQKYIPLIGKDGKLLPNYIITANLPCEDETLKANVLRGNNRVFNARAEDGAFFYNEDLKKGLDHYKSTLASVTFVDGGGSLADKTQRMQELASILGQQLEYKPNPEHLNKALSYLKADLATLMVGEFPELQGIMGSYYATAEGFAPEIVDAIRYQYDPLATQNPSPLTGFVGMIDRLDSLCTLYAVGKTVTGSRDPYALRRQTIAIIHILMAFNWSHFSTAQFLQKALPLYKPMLAISAEDWTKLLSEFIQTRLEGVLKSDSCGCSSDTVGAVLSTNSDNVLDCVNRAKALQTLRASQPTTLASLVELAKRVKNIVKGQENAPFDQSLLQDDAEKNLYTHIQKLETSLVTMPVDQAFTALLGLEPPASAFFQQVMVKCGGATETNRIALLQKMDGLFNNLADFSRLSLDNER